MESSVSNRFRMMIFSLHCLKEFPNSALKMMTRYIFRNLQTHSRRHAIALRAALTVPSLLPGSDEAPPWKWAAPFIYQCQRSPISRHSGAMSQLRYYENTSVFKKPEISSKFRPKFDAFSHCNFCQSLCTTILQIS